MVGTTVVPTATTTTSSTSNINAIQIIPKADSSGSFDAISVPAAGGASVKAQRIYNLDGSLINNGSLPTWFVEARVFLTTTRTSAGTPTNSGQDTPCAYFDGFTDNNPDTSAFYTIDGYNPETAVSGTDIDQCAGVSGTEASSIGMYVRVDRRFMNATDRLQLIVKAKPLDAPNTAPTVSSCVTGGFFDAGACSNQLYTVTRRSSPGAAAKPFFILFPSAKALDLLSESVLIPLDDTSITTISIDRVKGGAVFYGLSVIRLQ